MNSFDDSPSTPSEPAPGNDSPSPADHVSSASEPLGGDPLLSVTAYSPTVQPSSPQLPEDLQITWSWPHFIVFLVFCIVSFLLVNVVILTAYAPHQKMSKEQLQQYFMSKPQVIAGSMLLLYALIFLFLYVTLSTLRGHSFWKCLGWRKIKSRNPDQPANPLVYFFTGSGLSLFVILLTASMKQPDNIPMQELFRHRQTALLFMAMAVFVAPLVEETLFRGYLYPLFARLISALLRLFGFEDAPALQRGILGSIILTGVLFGLVHGFQLGWTWRLVSILTLVGTIFTFVRARTGSVFASFLMHLGYNSLIAAIGIVGTHGFTRIPAGQ
jgi:membrane protease YdiL (CAAX protease family)